MTPVEEAALRARVYDYIFSRGTYGATSDECVIDLGVECTDQFRQLKFERRIIEIGVWRKTRQPQRLIMPVCVVL